MRNLAALSLVVLLAVAAPAGAIEIDGHVDPAEWQGARHITDFRVVQPLTGEPARLATEAWVMATPEGLAVAFHNTQPRGVVRTRQRTRRDQDAQVDRVNVMVDFDGDGQVGYNLMITLAGGISDAVITNQSNFDNDWDAVWQHAVSEDAEGWSAEFLIPWYIAPMRDAVDGHRTIGLYLDRVIGSNGRRVAWPAASFQRPRFLSDFRHIRIPAYSQSLLAITPYVSGVYDNIDGSSDFTAGADIVWKPNGQTQLTATINPDFGQVESDELVINFDAQETFFSDKRPFFTENHAIFDFGLLIDNSQLIYTRRVGGPADDGSGAGDIAAAVKLNGSLGATSYGVMAADEKGDAGRSFRALRLNRDFGAHNLGLLATQVQRPFLDRRADVLGIDYSWLPDGPVSVLANVVGSHIDQHGRATNGSGATLVVDYEMNDRWRQQWLAMHFGDSLQINDFGYLSRNSLNYAHWQVSRRRTDLPPASAYSSHDWRFRIIGIDNDHGLRLLRQLRIVRQSDRRDGGSERAQLNVNAPAYQDLLTRGNGVFRVPGRFDMWWERSSPRDGHWAWEVEGFVGGGGLSGNDRLGYSLAVEPTFFFSHALSAFVELQVEHNPDWLVWQHDNLIASFDQRSLQLDAGLDWYVGDRHELRVKLQSIGLEARARQGYRVVDGRAVAVDEPIDDFSVRNLGFQVRYRYKLAPLSDLYVVYGRGGYLLDEGAGDSRELLGDSFSLRDDEQLLVKLSYRFVL